MSTVFVAAQESMVLGVYTTKEKAQARCDEWAEGAEKRYPWQRYDGAWRSYFQFEGENQLTLIVTEMEVDA